MTTKPVTKTARDRLAETYESMVTAGLNPTDYGPDDAVFTKAYGAPVPPVSKLRSPMALLHDYSVAFKEQGVSPPDLVFQTYREGREFFHACLSDGGTTLSLGTDRVDGMYIARVMGVNLIWPEE